MSGMFKQVADNGKDRLRESYFMATQPTLNAGATGSLDLRTNAVATVTATSPYITIANTSNANSGPTDGPNIWVMLDYLRLTCTEANTTAGNMMLVGVLDQGDRRTSGGVEFTPKSTSIDLPPSTKTYLDRTPKSEIFVTNGVTSPIVASAATSLARTVFAVTVSEADLAVDESVEIRFAGSSSGTSSALINSVPIPAVWIGRGCTLLIYELHSGAASAGKIRAEIGLIENDHPTFKNT